MKSQIIIEGHKAPLFIRGVLMSILIIFALIPILVTAFFLLSEKRLHITIPISFLINWGVGFYVLRLLLWNNYGREILTFEKDKILYVADYKYFKDGRKEISKSRIETELIYVDEPNRPLGRLRLKNEFEELETVLKIDLKKLEKIQEEIQVKI